MREITNNRDDVALREERALPWPQRPHSVGDGARQRRLCHAVVAVWQHACSSYGNTCMAGERRSGRGVAWHGWREDGKVWHGCVAGKRHRGATCSGDFFVCMRGGAPTRSTLCEKPTLCDNPTPSLSERYAKPHVYGVACHTRANPCGAK
eukprot:336978-Chlamydomonas_euryale.AAC.1